MSVRLRKDQQCSEPGCKRPALIGELCAACFYGATPARRAVELASDKASRSTWQAAVEIVQLEKLFALPSPTGMRP